MDLAFFGLRETPFNPTPNPKFLHLTPGHKEALAQLRYGVQERKGFILLTGEVGTGKTTLLRALLERLDSTVAVAFVTNPMLGFDGILEYVLEDLGIAKAGEPSPAQRLIALQNFLIERQRAGQNTVLVLDEAQDLDPRSLEKIRLLSNFEMGNEKLMQILLVGQPELRVKLERPDLRQLKQRIGLRCQIPPLTPGQVREYIRTRLRVAGAQDLGLFSPDAVRRIAEYSAGIPRLVNTVCDHCLLFAYADQVRRIGRDVVDQAIEYLEDGRPRPAKRSLFRGWSMTGPRWAAMAGSATAAGLAVFLTTHPDMTRRAVDFWASSFSNLARAARALLGV
jgi:general secretion pathway protein A